jgi:hypothetical protein
LNSTLFPALGEPARQRGVGSREQFEAYGEQLMPILGDLGIEFSAEQEICEVQHLLKR